MQRNTGDRSRSLSHEIGTQEEEKNSKNNGEMSLGLAMNPSRKEAMNVGKDDEHAVCGSTRAKSSFHPEVRLFRGGHADAEFWKDDEPHGSLSRLQKR